MTGGSVRAKVLVVDDDALVAMSIVDMLEDFGHEVFEANSGARALEILDSGQPLDLIITDQSMPGMTGTELALAVRQKQADLPVLLATGYADLPEGDALQLPRLAKPYDHVELAAQLAQLLNV
ncbi:response regulator [Mangrovibrevibacter kandeliae]|uniref:response regulator n=1 Tax=Mangrovibrevibacter kandeliae TaxID=2968473 RepID=UPI0035586475